MGGEKGVKGEVNAWPGGVYVQSYEWLYSSLALQIEKVARMNVLTMCLSRRGWN